jgi:protein SCO1/2
LAVLLSVLAALLAGCGASAEKAAPLADDATPVGAHSAAPGTYRGLVPDSQSPRPSFTLTDTAGRPFNFAAQTAGHPTLLYFGYTNCPDECPAAMADVAVALRKASPDLRQQVKVVFITTDPKRDTRTVLRRWLDQFDSSFIGLTGTSADLVNAEKAANIPQATIRPAQNGAYDVNHATLLLGYGADDLAHVVYLPGAKPSDITADLSLLAKKDPSP